MTEIMDYRNRMDTLKTRSTELLDDDEADFHEFANFFSFHNETREDILSDTEEEEELHELFKRMPDIEDEFDKNNSFFTFLKNFFSNSDYRIEIARKVVKSIIKIYDEIIQFLNNNFNVA